jgi:hypothetical protein
MHVPFFFLFAIILFVAPVIAKHGTVHAGSESRYTKAHSLRDGYKFDPRDGWHSVNATDLSYKYRRSDNAEFASGDMTRRSTEKDGNLGLAATAMQKIQNSLKGIGQAVPVIITWYAPRIDILTRVTIKHHLGILAMIWKIRVVGRIPSGLLQCASLHFPVDRYLSLYCLQDASFACALTLNGWTSRPKCFQFLERM